MEVVDNKDNFQDVAFCCMSRSNPVRRWAIKLLTLKWFERFSLLVIVVNCIGLTLNDPCDIGCLLPTCRTLAIVEYAVTAFFGIEMLIKMIAMGLYGKHSYFKEPWNYIDFFIVAISVTEIIFADLEINFSALRTFRILRPLRAVNRISSLRMLVSLLFDILPMLGNVMIFCVFVFFIFGLTFVQLWGGLLRQRCFFPKEWPKNVTRPPFFMPPYYNLPHSDYICTTSMGEVSCADIPLIEQSESMCGHLFDDDEEKLHACLQWVSNYTECRPDGPNPEMGTINFDNIGYAWVTIFQVISLESWSDIMYFVQDAFSFWSWTFFLALVLIGAYLAVNLCLVVITTQFSETQARELALLKATRGSTESIDSQTNNTGLYRQIIDIILDYCNEAKEFVRRTIFPNDTANISVMAAALILSVRAPTNPNCAACKHRLERIQGGEASLMMREIQCPFCGFNPMSKNRTVKFREQTFPQKIRYISCIMSLFRAKIRLILEHDIAVGIVIAIIAVNAFVMALEHHKQPIELTRFIETVNLVFTGIFVGELVIKLFAYGFSNFIREAFNMLDAIVIVMNLAELLSSNHGISGSNGLSVLRLFRLVRIVKILRFVPALQKQLIVMIAVVDNVASFFLLLCFFIFLEAVLGMSLFGCKFCSLAEDIETVSQPEPRCQFVVVPLDYNMSIQTTFNANQQSTKSKYECARANFDTPFEAFFTVLQVFTQDDWSSVMRDAMYYTSDMAAIYFVLLVTFGNFIIFNLLVAILVAGFSNKNENINSSPRADLEIHETEKKKKTSCLKQTFQKLRNLEISERSFFIFSPSDFPRPQLKRLLASSLYNKLFLIVIIGSCLFIAMERPSIENNSLERKIIIFANAVFTIIFIIEASLKMIAYGAFIGPDTYIRNGWNVLDLLLVFVAIVDLVLDYAILGSQATQVLKVLRSLRALRPLRMISRSQGLQIVIKTLLLSIKSIGNIIMIGLFLFTIFAILGVHLFKGCYASCSAHRITKLAKPDVLNCTIKETNVKTRDYMTAESEQECTELGFEWEANSMNFDNVPEAMMALFVFATLDGWTDITRNGVDCVGDGKPAVANYNMWAYLYFIAFLLIICFFMLNMFVGVVVENFQNVQRKILDSEPDDKKHENKQTRDRKFTLIQEACFQAERFPQWRRYLFNFVTHRYFEYAVIGAIVLSTALISCEYYGMSPYLLLLIIRANRVILLFMTVEMILKILVFGIVLYLRDRWNQFDAVIVVLSITGLILETMPSGVLLVNPKYLTFPRIFRIMRILKLMKYARGVRELLLMLTEALPQVANLSLFFFLLFYVYASLGVELYGNLQCSFNDCSGLTRHANFSHFGLALLTLFRIFTGDNWNDILMDILSRTAHAEMCHDNGAEGISCEVVHVIAPAYFISFVLIAQFILMNIVVAVFMSQLEEVHKKCEEDDEKSETPSIEEASVRSVLNDDEVAYLNLMALEQSPLKFHVPSFSIGREMALMRSLLSPETIEPGQPVRLVPGSAVLRPIAFQSVGNDTSPLENAISPHEGNHAETFSSFQSDVSKPTTPIPHTVQISIPEPLSPRQFLFSPETTLPAISENEKKESTYISSNDMYIGRKASKQPWLQEEDRSPIFQPIARKYHSISSSELGSEEIAWESTASLSSSNTDNDFCQELTNEADVISYVSTQYMPKRDLCDAEYLSFRLQNISKGNSSELRDILFGPLRLPAGSPFPDGSNLSDSDLFSNSSNYSNSDLIMSPLTSPTGSAFRAAYPVKKLSTNQNSSHHLQKPDYSGGPKSTFASARGNQNLGNSNAGYSIQSPGSAFTVVRNDRLRDVKASRTLQGVPCPRAAPERKPQKNRKDSPKRINPFQLDLNKIASSFHQSEITKLKFTLKLPTLQELSERITDV